MLFLAYDYFLTNFYKENKDGKIKLAVAEETGLTIRKTVFTHNNSQIKSYIDGATAFPAIENLIKSAKKTLFIETFIFHNDITGIKIANLLGNMKAKGIDVKVLIDSTGLKFGKDDSKIVDLLKKKKVDTLVFNSKFISETGINITHRKVIIVDGFKVMTGGMNFGKEYQYVWHDSMHETSGQVAQDIQKEFLYDWKRAGGEMPKNILKLDNKKYGNVKMKVITTNVTPDNTNHAIHDDFLSIIKKTKKTLKIQSPYFSDDDMIDAIIEARKRNVKVTIIMPQHNNHSVFKDLNLYTAKKFFDNKIDTYFYQPKFSHLKAFISDDIAIIGSANIDKRSFTGNQELCVVVQDKNFVADIEKNVFVKDIKASKKADENSTKIGVAQKTMIRSLEILDYYL